MKGHIWLVGCAVVAIVFGALFVQALAQSYDNPFGQVDGQLIVPVQQDADDPFRSGDALTIGQPQPTLAPQAAPQPVFPQPVAEQAEAPVIRVPLGNQGAAATCMCLGESGDSVANIKRALAGPLKSRGMVFVETSLEQIVNELSTENGIPIQLDISALEEAGLGPEDTVTINLHGISLRSALNYLLRQHTLTYILQDEVLLITTPSEAELNLKICLYDVRDLIAGPEDAAGIDNLIDVIQVCVATETWAQGGGGTGSIRSIRPGLLAISQTRAVHEQIGELVTAVRQMSKQPPLAAAAAQPAGPPRIVTRHYVLQVTNPQDQDGFQKQLRELIVALVPDQGWNGGAADGEPVLLTVLPDRIVVRHNELVQRKVEAALVETGIALPSRTDANASRAARPAGMGGGGFGGGGGGGGGGFFSGGGGFGGGGW